MTHRSLGTTLALAALAAGSYAMFCRRCHRRGQTRAKSAPGHIQTWESEGGGVPVDMNRTAAQIRSNQAPPLGMP